MPEEVVFLVMGICTLGAAMVLVPFLLHHQRKMAEILHQKNVRSDELSKRLDSLTDAVYQLASQLDHAAGRNGSVTMGNGVPSVPLAESDTADAIAQRLQPPPRLG